MSDDKDLDRDRTFMFLVGANWASEDSKRTVVINQEIDSLRGRAFVIRNVATGRSNRIELGGLTRKFRFLGYDPAYLPERRQS
ncbi:hypothetical protein AB4Z39_31635 [Mycobacterium adipatum]|uniref:hypothetical protein n=1 Tax=Mycobacterium adipatum TaxID=1682113 RepID=UPI0034E0DCD9